MSLVPSSGISLFAQESIVSEEKKAHERGMSSWPGWDRGGVQGGQRGLCPEPPAVCNRTPAGEGQPDRASIQLPGARLTRTLAEGTASRKPGTVLGPGEPGRPQRSSHHPEGC